MSSLKSGIYSDSGFTLTEIILTVGIVAILMGLASVTFSDRPRRYQFEDERNRVYAALTASRNIALARKECVQLRINNDRHMVARAFSNGGANTSCDFPLVNPTLQISYGQISREVTISRFMPMNDINLLFAGTGGLYNVNETASVQLSDSHNNAATIRIYPGIGQIRKE